jgi:large-conductance mechanosensitive channel
MAVIMAKSKLKRNTQQVTSSGAIRFEVPTSTRQRPKVIASPDLSDIHPVSGFLEFLREHSVVSLAIAFVIGLQSQTLVKQLVASFIDPLFKLLFGQALSLRTFTLHFHGRTANFSWGSFAYGLLNFLFVLGAVYAIVKILNLDKLDKSKTERKPEPRHKRRIDHIQELDD